MVDQNPVRKLSKKLHKVLQIDFSKAFDENEIKLTRKLYKQCCKLVTKEKQKSLIRILTIGRIYCIPFLLLLVDCYTRDRFDEYIDNKSNILTVSIWTQELIDIVCIFNKSIKSISNDIESSIDLCFKRYAGKFQFKQCIKIKDDRLKFANYALAGAYFVDRLVDRERAIPPFQIDFMILPSSTKSIFDNNINNIPQSYTGSVDGDDFVLSDNEENKKEDSDDDDDDDDDIDDLKINGKLNRIESHSDIQSHSIKNGLLFIENLCFGKYSIESRLKNKECIYDSIFIDKNGISSQPNRLFYQFYNKSFSNKIGRKYNRGLSMTEKLKYPHGKRINIVINRWRDLNKMKINEMNQEKENKKHHHRDKIFIFEPDKNQYFPPNFVSEWGLDAAFTSIIPSFGDKKNEKSPEKKSISASDVGEGFVFVLSFQIYSKYQIRCYCCYGGQMFRFLPIDITTIWLQIFDESIYSKWKKSSNNKNKEKYKKRDNQIKKIQKEMIKLMEKWDLGFTNFRTLSKFNG